jgi:transposase
MPQASVLHGDKGYDSDTIRRQVEGKGGIFGRLKDFRRIAARYDRLSRNFLAAVYLAATVSYWL